ncbi:uncharacterized protein [Ptychodera flava]|uniref:uncharacterized protein n=1 Tax=Ptychodera flava TaxID=63121 RepID=UPI00396A86F3
MSRLVRASTFLLSLSVFLPNLPLNNAQSCDDPRPKVSLEEATSGCSFDREHCDIFGLDFLCTQTYGRFHPCSGDGDDVMCVSPDRELAAPTPAKTLKVLAYNVLELRYVYAQSGQRERTCRIPQKIFDHHADVDVIVFNEAFMGGCFPDDGISFRDMLTQYGFAHFTETVGTEKSLLPIPFPPDLGNFPPTGLPDISAVENGGIFIASRWPILQEAQMVFKNGLVGIASNKGVAYAKIEKDDGSDTRYYHVFGTHLQAGFADGIGDEIRNAQAWEMKQFVEEQNIPANEPVIYAGDFNNDLYGESGRWDQMLEILEANMPEIVGDLNVTLDYANNDVRADPSPGGKWIDYVIYSNQHVMPNEASQESIKYTASEPFTPCMAALPISERDEPIQIGPIELPIPIEFSQYRYHYEEKCLDSWNVTDLSDHYAVLGVFDFSKPIDPIPNPTPPPMPEECNDNRPQVWLGYATDECDLTPDHCAMFGLEYVCSAPYNVWDNCYVKPGQNVLCAIPDITLPDPTPATTFKVLAYNVYELRYLYYQSGQHERTCRILPEIFTRHGDLDAIIFNEAFMGGCFANDGASFRQIMDYYGFPYFTGTVGENLILPPENGGVFIASRWPIARWDETVYESVIAPSDDALAAKGSIYAEIHKSVDGSTRKYHVLGTHLHAGDSDRGGNEARVNQTKEMHQLMLEQNIPRSEAVIYGGDLNNDYYTKPDYLADMLEALEADLPPIEGSINVTSDSCYNDIKYSGDDPEGCARNRNWLPGSWIDYVLYSHAHLEPVSATQESIKYADSSPMSVCMDGIRPLGGHIYPYDPKCNQAREITDLADHYAVLGRFDFDVPEVPCYDPRLQVWLGDVTSECDLDASYCTMFGLDYVCSEDYSNSHRCGGVGVTDVNVLCAMPDRVLPPPTPATTLKVLAYNVWELSYVYYQNGQYERTCRIPQEIFQRHGDVDVIVFNEVFMGGCFASDGMSFRDILKEYGFKHFTKTVGEDKSLLPLDPSEIPLPPNLPPDFTAIENGGVFIASRWPILAEAEKVFENAVRPSPDALANKGAMYVKIEKDDGSLKRVYHVLGTHLQAGFREMAKYKGDEIRALQAQEMFELMKEQNIPADEPVIYAGDLNTNLYGTHGRWGQMLEILQANMPEIVGHLNYTSDKENNDVNRDPQPGDGGSWIDYVIYSHQHLMPNEASQESIKYVASEPFVPCMAAIPIAMREEPLRIGPIEIPIPIELGKHHYAYQPRCRDSWNVTDLSDHYAVLGVFDFSSPLEPMPQPPTLPPVPEECTSGSRPNVWLGYATSECNLTASHCEMFGLEHVCTARYNTVDLCYVSSGENVLCAVPSRYLPNPTPVTTFKVLSYNVYELRYILFQTGQRERTCRILPEIFSRHGDIDAIIFNEVFMGGCFPDDGASFREILDYYGFKHFTATVGEHLILPPENGGVFIASRWPIVRSDETVYESKVVPSRDVLASRGAVYAQIRKSVDGVTMNYHVLGTHLHSGDDNRGGDDVRLNQTKEMHQLMLKQNIPRGEAVIYGGDFNNDKYTKAEHLDAMLTALDADLPARVGTINVTFDSCYNDIRYDGDDPMGCARDHNWLPGSWIDYVLYSRAHLLPMFATQESVKFVDYDSFNVCIDDLKPLGGHIYPYQDSCNSPRTITDLADHYAVLGHFDYSKEEEVSSSAKLMSSLVFLAMSAISAMFST